jgi:hypothetical protein
MDKIATAEEVQAGIKNLWALTEEPNPSREKLAAALSELAARVAGYSYKPETESYLFWGKGPFNRDVIDDISKAVIPFKDDEGKAHDDGFLHVEDHKSGPSVNRLKEDEGYTQEVLVKVSFPSGSEDKVLPALKSVAKKNGLDVEKSEPGHKLEMRLSEKPKKKKIPGGNSKLFRSWKV